MKYIFVFTLILFFKNSVAQWKCKVSTEPLDYLHISIADDSVGYILPEGGCILCIFNRGDSILKKNLYGHNTSLQFLNNNTGYVSGEYGVRKTTDGADNWEKVLDVSTDYVLFVNDSVGYASGYYDIKGIYKTTDYGNSWKLLPASSAYHAKHINCINEKICYAFSPYGPDIKTTNGGQTWQEIEEDLDIIINSSYFFNQSEGFVLGSSYSSVYVYKTTNGCKSFDMVYSTFERLGKIFFIDRERGFLIGGYVPGVDNPLLLVTIDGGKTWHNKNPECNKIGLESIGFFNDAINGNMVGIVCGWEGQILRAESPLNEFFALPDTTSINTLPKDSVFTVFPNPFTDTFSFTGAAQINQIAINDLLGRPIEFTQTGNEISISQSVHGVLILVITTEDKILAKTILKD